MVTVRSIGALWSALSAQLCHFLLFMLITGLISNICMYILHGNCDVLNTLYFRNKVTKTMRTDIQYTKSKHSMLQHPEYMFTSWIYRQSKILIIEWQRNLPLRITAPVVRYSWGFRFQHSGWERVETYKLHLADPAEGFSTSVSDPSDCNAEFVAKHCRECEDSINVQNRMILDSDCTRQGSWWETVVVHPGEIWEKHPVHTTYLKPSY